MIYQVILDTKPIFINKTFHIRYGDDAKAIYQNKASRAFLYYVVDNSEGYVGWAIDSTKNNAQTPIIKISDRQVLKSVFV